MSEFILTQDSEFVSCDYIKQITTYSGVIETDEGDTLDGFEIVAVLSDSKSTEVTLGTFFSESDLSAQLTAIANWLNEKNDYKRLFKMTPPNDEVDIDYSGESDSDET